MTRVPCELLNTQPYTPPPSLPMFIIVIVERLVAVVNITLGSDSSIFVLFCVQETVGVGTPSKLHVRVKVPPRLTSCMSSSCVETSGASDKIF